MPANYSIIYNTCDKYEFLWPGFFTLFKKYWPDFKQKIILNTETKSFQYPGLDIVRPGCGNPQASWSQRLIYALDSITTPYVLLILDDFWFKGPVRTEVLQECLNRLTRDHTVQSFTFAWQPGPNTPDSIQPEFEVRGRWAPYRINAQIALWRVDYLRKILRTYENPWQFEISGSFRSSIYGGKLLSLKKTAAPVFDYDFGFLIIRGQLNKKVADYFAQAEGLNVTFPIQEFSENSGVKPRGDKPVRLFLYFKDMLVSLFRK